MSEDRAADDKATARAGPALPPPLNGVGGHETFSSDSLDDMTPDIFSFALLSLIHNTASTCHRTEKQLRMQSAATHAESLALSSLSLDDRSQKPNSTSTSTSSTAPPAIPSASTHAAKYDNGRVYLKGNSLQTTPEIVCPHCKLPRLMHPIMGKGARNPDLRREYCKLYPFVQEKGHDVYGNPFPTDMAKSKKERELIKQQQKNAEKESVGGTPGSQQDSEMGGGQQDNGSTNNGGGSGGANGAKEIKLNTGGKPASYIPWHTCPNCKRSLLITRFAQHLEKCLGISGRQSSRNAMAKLTGSQNGTSNTPLNGSRMGTPTPGSQGEMMRSKSKLGRADDDDRDDDSPEKNLKKKPKKNTYIRKAERERMAKEGSNPSSILKVKIKPNGLGKERDSERKASFNGSPEKPDKSERQEKQDKRERERDENDEGSGPKTKKLKLSLGRSESAASMDKEQGKREMW